LRVEFPDFGQEGLIRPQAARGSFFRIVFKALEQLCISGIFGLLGPHQFSIGLVIPHLIAQKWIHEDVWLMHMAHHTLTGRNGARQFVADGVAWLVFGDRGILRKTEATVAKLRVRARIPRITIIGIYRMAGRATARTVISGMIVRSQER